MPSDDPRLLVGDAASTLETLPPESVDMVLTSPPYANALRDYGMDDQLGHEGSVQGWVDNMLRVIEPLKAVLKLSGTLWLNVGDSYSRTPGNGAPKKSLLLGPERLAIAMVESGWVLRNKVVWAKPNGLPTAVSDRLRNQWEVVYVFTKSPRYFFDLDAVRAPHLTRPPRRREHAPTRTGPDPWQGKHGDRGDGLKRNRALGKVGHDLGKNPGDVWTIPVSAWKGDHHATFPVALAEQCVRAGCPEGICGHCGTPWRRGLVRKLGGAAVRGALRQTCDCPDALPQQGVVLDPFMGSGTTAIAAENLGRDWQGIELNPDYAKLALARIDGARSLRLQRPPRRGAR
ncbi:site-specific DNA-methyltransferase [Microbacterium sp. NPDC086615]|uniref:DNA-methyltransferase n=1 Tax=Microbacterium sp. NPDC086615 TaxID=3154865 RepID=UPI0034488B94